MDDWLAAVCLPRNPMFETTTRSAVGGTTCVPRSGVGYVNFDEFDSEADMNTILGPSSSNYSAKTTLHGNPLAIWIPASRDGSELAPLKQFGFVVTQQQSTSGQPLPSAATANSVPGLVQGAALGQSCSNYRIFIFGVGQDGTPMACTPGVAGGKGQWVRSQPVLGTFSVGTVAPRRSPRNPLTGIR